MLSAARDRRPFETTCEARDEAADVRAERVVEAYSAWRSAEAGGVNSLEDHDRCQLESAGVLSGLYAHLVD